MTSDRPESIFNHHLDIDPATVDFKQIPHHGGVYLLSDAERIPVLLASAQDLRSAIVHRLSPSTAEEKTKRADLRGVTRMVHWVPAFSRFETDLRYWQAARALYPDDYLKRIPFAPSYFLRADPTERTPR